MDKGITRRAEITEITNPGGESGGQNAPNLVDRLRNPRKRALVEWLAKLFFARRFAVQVSGLDAVNEFMHGSQQPVIVVSNHAGFWDGFLYGLLIPKLDFAMAKEECWLKPLYRFFVPDLGGIPAVRRHKLGDMKRRYPGSYDRFISPDGRFRFDQYFPRRLASAYLEDIVRTVSQSFDVDSQQNRKIQSMADIDCMVVSQYVLLQGKSMLHFYQGTRYPNHCLDGEQSGVFNVLANLAVFHGMRVPYVPSGIWYENPSAWGSRVVISFGSLQSIEGYLAPGPGQLNLFFADLKARIRSLLVDCGAVVPSF